MKPDPIRKRAIELFIADSVGLANEASFELIAEEERRRFYEMAAAEMNVEIR